MKTVSDEVWKDLDINNVIKRKDLFVIDENFHIELGPRCSYGKTYNTNEKPVWFRTSEGEYQISNKVYNLDKLAPTQITGGDKNCGTEIYVIECDLSDDKNNKQQVGLQQIIDDNLKLCERILLSPQWLPQPFRIVFSGSKSLHLLFRANRTVTPTEHRYVHNQLAMMLNVQNYDSQCCNVGRQTRYPNAINQKTGRKQHLLYFKDNIFNIREEWLDEFKDTQVTKDEELTKYIPPKNLTNSSNDSIKGMTAEEYFHSQISSGCLSDGKRHDNVPRIVCALKAKGLDASTIQQWLSPYLNKGNLDLYNNIPKLWANAPIRDR